MSSSRTDHEPEARNSAAFAISALSTSAVTIRLEGENESTLWDTITTQWVYLPDLVDIATLTGLVENRSRQGCLDKSRTKGVDTDVGALELPRSCLRNGDYTRIDEINADR